MPSYLLVTYLLVTSFLKLSYMNQAISISGESVLFGIKQVESNSSLPGGWNLETQPISNALIIPINLPALFVANSNLTLPSTLTWRTQVCVPRPPVPGSPPSQDVRVCVCGGGGGF